MVSPADSGNGEAASGDLLDAALAYARDGLPVLPLNGKIPRTANGLKDASTDANVIAGWWRSWPDANVGIRTGAESGVVVLDVDPRHGGTASLLALKKKHGRLSRGPQVLTGGGGAHIYFHPGGELRNSAGQLGDGLDIRSDGGYVVAPPSLHESGNRYKWLHEFDRATLADPGVAENVSREEWEQVAGNLNYLSSVASAAQEQQQAEATEAAILEWLGDEFEDPDGYEERRQELWKLSIHMQMAPYVQFFQEQQEARMLAEAEASLDQLLAAEAKAAGVELSGEARQVVFDALLQVAEGWVRDGMSVEEATVRAAGLERQAVQLHVQALVPKKPGNEFAVVKKHFPTGRPGTEPRPPSTAAQREIIDRVLR